MQKADLYVAEILGKTSAILHSDGLILFDRLQKFEENAIHLSFKDITHCTTAFLNASIGKFLIANQGRSKVINFLDVSEDIQNKIELVQDNARSEKKRNSLNASARAYLHG